ISTLSQTLECLPQAPMTNTSLTAMQAMVSTPLALSSAAFSTKPGRCLASQVGGNAPGTENNTTFFPLNSASVVRSCGPSLVIVLKVPAGILSPGLIAMFPSPCCESVACCRGKQTRLHQHAGHGM